MANNNNWLGNGKADTWLGYVGSGLFAGIGGVLEGVTDALGALAYDITGNHDKAESLFKNSWNSQWHKSYTEDYEANGVEQFASDVLSGVGQSAYLFIPYAGVPLFFTGIISQSISGAAEQTGDVGIKEAAYGITTGAIEGGLELALGAAAKGAGSIASALGKKTGKSVLKSTASAAARKGIIGNVLSSAASEFMEEATSEVADTILQRAYQIDPNKTLSVRDVLYAGAVGAVSGAVTTSAVAIPSAVGNRTRGSKIIKNGNEANLVDTATFVADRMAADGTSFENSTEWLKMLRGEIDAYNKLSESGKKGLSGQTILGEMQSSLYFIETKANVEAVKQKIQNADEQTKATWAEYINSAIPGEKRRKIYTAADISKDTDGMARELAIMAYAGASFDLNVTEADIAAELEIENVIAQESGKVAAMPQMMSPAANNVAVSNNVAAMPQMQGAETKAAPSFEKFVQMQEAQRSAEVAQNADVVQSRAETKSAPSFEKFVQMQEAQRGAQAAQSADVVQSKAETKTAPSFEKFVQMQEAQRGAEVAQNADVVQSRAETKTAPSFEKFVQMQEAQRGASVEPENLRSDAVGAQGVQLNAETVQNGAVAAEDAVGAVITPHQSAEQTASPRGEALVESSSKDGAIERATSSSTVSDGPPSPLEKADVEKAKRDAERMVEWEKKTKPTVDEMNTARTYVKGFDNLDNRRRSAIIRMIRSSKDVDAETVKGVANLVAVNPKSDLDVRFSDSVDKNGLVTKVGNKTVVIVSTKASKSDTYKGTIAHELVHYLEGREGYAQFAEYVRKHAKAEAIKKIEDEYNLYYEYQYKAEEEKKTPNATSEEIGTRVGKRMNTEEHKKLIDSEVTASLVGKALNSDKLLKRYASRDQKLIKRIVSAVKQMSKRLDEENADGFTRDTVYGMVNRFNVLLQMPESETGGVHETKYEIVYDSDTKEKFVAISLSSIDELNSLDGDSIAAKVRLFMKRYRGTVLPLGSTDKAYMRREAEGEYTNPAKAISDVDYQGKLNAASELSNLLLASEYVRHEDDNGRHPDAVRGWNYYKINYVVPIDANDIRAYTAEIQIKLIQKGDCFYDITKIKDITNSTAGQAFIKAAGSVYDASTNSIHQNEPVVNTSDKKSSEERKYDLGDSELEAEVDREFKEAVEGKVAEKKKKAAKSGTAAEGEGKAIRTGSAEAGRLATRLGNEFGFKKATVEKIRAKLEALEAVFIKGTREEYVEEYKKRVQEIFAIIAEEGEFELSSEQSYKEFQTYMRGKKFRFDKRFRQNMGKEEWKGVWSVIRGRLASDNNKSVPHVDAVYAELNELFPGFFPDDIINVHDQLSQIAKIMTEAKDTQSDLYSFAQLPPEWQVSITNDLIDQVRGYIERVSSNRDAVRILKEERADLFKQLRQERTIREKMAREEANAAKAERARRYTKKEVAPAVSEIEALTDAEVKSLARGFELEGMSRERRELLISDIYIALHEQSAKGEAGPGSVAVKTLATKMAWDMIESARIVDEDGKYYHLVDIYDEASVQALADEYANVLYERFVNMGEHTQAAYFRSEVQAVAELFKKEQINDRAIGKQSREVSYQGQKLRELVEHQKRNSEDAGIMNLTKVLASIVDAKGNIRTNVIDGAIAEADAFFEGNSGKLESDAKAVKEAQGNLTDFAYEEDPSNLKFYIDEFKRLRSRVEIKGGKPKARVGGSLDAQEMKLLGKILAGMRKTINEYNKEFVNGHLVNRVEVAQDGAKDILEYLSLEKQAKTKIGEIFNSALKAIKQAYFYNVLSPETVVEALEGFKANGILKTLYHDVRIHKQKAEHMAVRMKKPFAEFLDSKGNQWTDPDGKKHSFRDKLNEKTIEVNGANLTLGEAIYLYMLTKRELTHAGLKEKGYIVYDENNQRRATVKIDDVEVTRGEIASKLDSADKAFLKMAEDFFNITSTEVKNEADMRIFGFTNIEDGYYVPMIRDRYSRMQGVTDQRQSVGSIITVYNKSFNQSTIQNAKGLEGKNIMSIINDHADGLADYSELYIPLKSFDRIYNQAVSIDGEIRTIREILNNKVWNKTETYFKDLFADIQGQNRKSDNVVDSIVGRLRSAWVNSVLGLNLKVVATQTTSFVAANQVIEAKYLMPAMKKFFGDQSALGARADKYSDIIEARSFEMGALKAQGNIDKVAEWSSKTGFMINLMDRRVCLAVFHAAELKAEALGRGKVGTEENARAAAKIADEAIYTTQAMTSASERSALQRSKSEIARTLSMFTSDSVKNLSHFIGNIMKLRAHKTRANSNLASKAEYEALLKKDSKAVRRSAKTLIMTGVMLGLITQAFKYLYAKEEEEPEDKLHDLATDVVSSTLNIFPVVSDVIDKFVFDYDLSLNVFDIVNDTIEDTASVMNMAGRAMSGEYVSGQTVFKTTSNFAKTVLSVSGMPVAPVERTITGLMRRIIPTSIYGYDAAMYNTSYTADLKAAVENGDEALAEHILQTLYKNEATGVYSTEELEEIARLYSLTDEDGKHYDVLPQKIGDTINDVKLTAKQRRQFEGIYSQASEEVNKLIRSDYYYDLNDEQRAKAIKNIYALYYNRAAAEVTGKEWTNAQAYSRLTDNLSALYSAQAYKSGLEPYKNLRGKEVTVKEQFTKYVKNLKLSKTDELVVLYANGYRDKSTKAQIIAYINSLSVSEAERKKIALTLGFDYKDGKVIEKKEELEVRAE